jgi:methyl-accepting chemotaxis protein
MEKRFKERRRTYFIKKRFQAGFILKFCILVIIGSIISGGIIYTLTRATVTTSFEDCRLKIKSTADYILPAVLFSSAVVILFIGLSTVLVTLFASHRIAGPLYRMEKDLQQVVAGDLTKKFHLRRTDEIKALAEGLNIMTDSLRTNIADIKQGLSELESTLQARPELPKELKEKMHKLKSALDRFKT